MDQTKKKKLRETREQQVARKKKIQNHQILHTYQIEKEFLDEKCQFATGILDL